MATYQGPYTGPQIDSAIGAVLAASLPLVDGAVNIGGGSPLFKNKSGSSFQFRTIVGLNDAIVTQVGDTITIDVTTGSTGEANTASNTGGGSQVFKQKTGADLEFRTLVGLNDAIVTQNADTVSIDVVAASGEINTASNVGTGADVFRQKTAANLEFRTLIAGTNISLTQNVDNITISASASGETNTASNVGAGVDVFKQKTGVDLEFRTLIAGTNITLTQNVDNITIDASAAGEINTASNLGIGFGLFEQKIGSDLQFKSILNTGLITITESATPPDTLVISTLAEANSASSVGVGEPIFKQKTGTDLQFRTLIAGTNISLALGADEITISASASGETNTASNVGAGVDVFKQKTGVDLEFRTLVGGSNITLTQNSNNITIDASAAGEANTASNVGAGVDVFKQKVGADLEFRSIVAGSDISVTENTDDVIIAFNGTLGETNTMSNVGVGAGVFKQKSGVDFELRTILAGTNITVVQNSDDITISSAAGAGEANTASNIGVGNEVFKQKSGVDLEFRSLVGGSDISITTNSNDLTIAYNGTAVQTASSVGAGAGVFKQKTGTDLQFRSITTSENMRITEDTNEVTINEPYKRVHAEPGEFTSNAVATSPATVYSYTFTDIPEAGDYLVTCHFVARSSSVASSNGWQLDLGGTSTPSPNLLPEGTPNNYVGIEFEDKNDQTPFTISYIVSTSSSGTMSMDLLAGRISGSGNQFTSNIVFIIERITEAV